jgi:glutamate synthase (NADPH/NADH) large chain
MTNRRPGEHPGPVGLYRPESEHDACGVSFVCDLHGRPSHDLVAKGLTSLCNLDHRGATGAETNTGDGAGILIQVPDAFLRAVVTFDLPERGPTPSGPRSCPRMPPLTRPPPRSRRSSPRRA